MKQTPFARWLTAFRVADGMVLENLGPGRFRVTGACLPALQELAAAGGLFPYEVDVESYSYHDDLYVILVKETGQ